jgi:hypothetical protein
MYSLLQLMRSRPDANCRFKVPFYPVTQILGIGLAFYLNLNSVIYGGAWIHIVTIIKYFKQKA